MMYNFKINCNINIIQSCNYQCLININFYLKYILNKPYKINSFDHIIKTEKILYDKKTIRCHAYSQTTNPNALLKTSLKCQAPHIKSINIARKQKDDEQKRQFISLVSLSYSFFLINKFIIIIKMQVKDVGIIFV